MSRSGRWKGLHESSLGLSKEKSYINSTIYCISMDQIRRCSGRFRGGFCFLSHLRAMGLDVLGCQSHQLQRCHSVNVCGHYHEGSSHLSRSRLMILYCTVLLLYYYSMMVLSRCKFSTLTADQPMVEFGGIIGRSRSEIAKVSEGNAKTKLFILASLSVSGSILRSSKTDPRATINSSVFFVPLKLPGQQEMATGVGWDVFFVKISNIGFQRKNGPTKTPTSDLVRSRSRTSCLKKNQNAPRPSEHLSIRGETMSKRLGGIKGCKYKISSWYSRVPRWK